MDQVIDYQNYEQLREVFSDKALRRRVRLVSVFGCAAEEVIYVTNDDKVYGFGRNRFGGLGLGTDEELFNKPTLNQTLSGKQLKNFFFGFEHWMALTSRGLVYGWGHNSSGQLGIGSLEPTTSPTLIGGIAEHHVIDVSCGGFFTLALTCDGQVFGWGANQFGQLGDGSFVNTSTPKHIPFDEKIASLTCGVHHSIALTVTGRALVWGLNGYGQLGREVRHPAYFPRPEAIPTLEDTVFAKSICGPNHSLLLTIDGSVFAFGENTGGQVGNGLIDHQWSPFRVKSDVQFKDIIGNKENDVSIAVSEDNRVFVWGLAKNRRYLTPQDITSGDSVFDIYAKVVKKSITFKTVVIDSELKTWELINEDLRQQTIDRKITKTEELFTNSKRNAIKTTVHSSTKGNGFSVEDYLDIKSFENYDLSLMDPKLLKNLRLFVVFQRGNSVIYVTNEDRVYGMGFNKNGDLGFNCIDYRQQSFRSPQLNRRLSGKQLVDIACGFEHCIGLTATGECYGWGVNRYGQLGIGSYDSPKLPEKITEFIDKTVVQICCGAYHSLALTSDGEVFSWGHNTFAQLGDKTYNSRDRPTQLLIRERVVTISCGVNHNMVLTTNGRVFLWGSNDVGQLGRPKEFDVRPSRRYPVCNRPQKLCGFDDQQIVKVLCGPNHTILLTSEGYVYAFGDNTDGQVGNGSTNTQFTPHLLNRKIIIKDIITNRENSLSIAVCDKNKVFYWGWAQKQRVLKPKALSPDLYCRSLFDIYVKLAKEKVTHKTLNLNEDVNQLFFDLNNGLNEDLNELNIESKHNSNEKLNNFDEKTVFTQNIGFYYENDDNSQEISEEIIERKDRVFGETPQTVSSVKELSIVGKVFIKHLNNSYNNPNKSDLKICSEDKVIYCHKTVLKIRNDRFWEILSEKLTEDNVIRINPKTFDSFVAFLKIFYGLDPEIDVRFVEDLQNMANCFGEPEIECLCADYCRQLRDCISVSNVCPIYEMAINRGLTDLETECIEFVSKHTKSVIRSDTFGAMDDSLSKRLMNSIINRKN